MTPKRYLKRYFYVSREIDAILSKLVIWKGREELIREFDPNGMELIQTRMYMRQSVEQIERYSAELKEAEGIIIKMISALETPQEREVLTYRYIDGMRWEDIAEKMYYAEDTLYNWHKRALDHLKFPVN